MRTNKFGSGVTRVISLLLVAALVLGGTGMWAAADTPAPSSSPHLNFPPVRGTFTDSTGLVWRVLHEDANHNRLIITETVQTSLWYVISSEVNWVPFLQSNLRIALNSMTLAPEIAANALLPNGIENDVRNRPGNFNARENEAIGRTSAGAPIPPTNAANGLFVLSLSEANHYFANNAARRTDSSWWLRSPGDTNALSATVVQNNGSMTAMPPFTTHGLRPALWVSGVPTAPPCCDLYPDCTCDEPPCCDLYPDCTCDEPPCCDLYPGCTCGLQVCCPEYPACTCPEFHGAFMRGDPLGNFLPRAYITRAEVAVILARTHIANFVPGTLPPGMTSIPFADTATHWARFYIAWAYDANLILGDGGNFRPGAFITRQELAAVLARAGGAVRPAGIIPFFDAGQISPWARNYVYTVYREALMIGDESNNFNPQANITRAEVATAVNRMLGRIDSHRALNAATVVGMGNARNFPDVASNAWYFPSVLAAANDHDLTRDNHGQVDWKQLRPQP